MRLIAWSDRHPLPSLALILLLALIVNGAWLWHAPVTLFSGETQHWWPLVLNVAHGRGYVLCSPDYFPFCGPSNQITAQREPVPVLAFAGVARLSNDSLAAAVVVELAANLALVPSVFCLARELAGTIPAGTRGALIAALLWAVYLPAVWLVPQISGELLAALFCTWGLFFLIRAGTSACTRDWLAAGACLGCGALSRSVVLGVAVAIALVLLIGRRFPTAIRARTARRLSIARLKPFSLFAMALAVIYMPWLIRNDAVFGHPVIGSTLADYNFYRENQSLADADDDYLRFVGPDEAKQAIKALVAHRPDLRGTENEAQMDSVYRAETMRIIKTEPLRYVVLSAYRFFMLWFDWRVREAYGDQNGKLYYPLIVQHSLLLILAAIGLRGTWPRGWPLALSILVVTLLHMATISRLRFIIPFMPLVIVPGAVGCVHLALNWQRQRLRTLAIE
jgi:Dolichyl-phosphate-mannose-protein mannosyltransferase